MKKILINSCACYGSNDIHECYCNLNQNNMKTQEEIEQLAEEYESINGGAYSMGMKDAYIDAYTQCQEDNKNEIHSDIDFDFIVYRWTYSEIFDACFPTLGRGGDWAAIAKRLIEQKEKI